MKDQVVWLKLSRVPVLLLSNGPISLFQAVFICFLADEDLIISGIYLA
ncbi:hypothetical protein FM109_14170 [Vibrio casei]|nr:hypothetical protein FM109_14170 [Vibrio casei]